MNLPYADKVNYYKTGTTAADTLIARACKMIEDVGVTDLDMVTALAILSALAVTTEDAEDNPMGEEDEQILMLLRPDCTRTIFSTLPPMDSRIRMRVAQAIAQCIGLIRQDWEDKYGSYWAPEQPCGTAT